MPDTSEPPIIVAEHDGVLTIRFNRPRQHNALSEEMYDALRRACEQVTEDRTVRCLVLRGTPGGAFASGTDISRFAAFRDGEDGIAYELGVQRVLQSILDVPVPTVAIVEGYALGGGLMIASACDLRIAGPGARFGVPIALTLGNCLSQFGYDLVADRLGPALALRLLLLGDMLDAEDAHRLGYVAALHPAEALDEAVDATVARLLTHAPLTMWAAKQADRNRHTGTGSGDEFVRRCYGSADFKHAVSAFTSGQRASWRGI